LKKSPSGSFESQVYEPRHQVPSLRAVESAAPAPKAEVSPAKIIKSPMVGTFYAAPAPDAPPFVQPGQQVEIGQVICVIEAMKLMNEIKAEVRGKIAEVLVNNGDPVEFAQALFRIE
jgi:acetyl-CoA carboxylase biotin carboxyl carrier protein